MKKLSIALIGSFLILGGCFFYLKTTNQLPFGLAEVFGGEEGEEDEGESRLEKYRQEFEQMKDPSLGRIPSERLIRANEITEELKEQARQSRVNSLSWTERGPIYDSLGPSNGNTRAGSSYTSGMIPTFLVDTLNDPTGNTVFIGSSGGGLWKCTNFLSTSSPNWVPVNDYMANLGIASICQDPSNPSVMYMATGDGNTLDVRGFGLWKSTNAGTTWTQLATTTGYRYGFRLICDANGIVYFASGGNGLLRSSDGGSTWQSISPSGNTASNASYVTDLELSSTGRLHASFGYLGTAVRHYYTDIPATVTSATGWNLSTGIRLSGTACTRMELAAQGNVLYALTSNGSYNLDSSYKSVDGGATWTKQNTAVYPAAFGNGQGYYNITLSINPDNSNEFIAGGIDAYRSTNSGVNITKITNWVSTTPYVHADHHYMQWWKVGSESRVIIASDGGMFLSRDGGVTWRDRNENLGIKQFYSAAIHPTAGTDYFLGGTQDNGSHQLKQPGLGYSHEVTGGDGAFVHINQQNPSVQFTSYVYNQYRRSTDGGTTWASVNFSTSTGFFINPFDYDDAQNIMYASNAVSAAPNNTIRRWTSANTGTTSTIIVVPELTRSAANSNASAFKMSPYTANRLFIGGSTGKLLRVENANTIATGSVSPNVTDITGASFPSGYLNCITVGTSDQYLVATFTNYGVSNIWFSADGGTSWTAIDGNLPDMPVWSAIFEPGTDNRLIIGTESGVFTTNNINGASTVWTANPDFPTVRTTMLKVRASDNTVVASTYGRGIYTTVIPSSTNPEINFTTPSTTAKEDALSFDGCRGYRDYFVNVSLPDAPTGAATVTYSIQGGATAVQGRDFDFTTNGNFTSPSNQHVFASGQTSVKQITVRVYDDAQVDASTAFTLTYAISGATNAVAGSTNTHVFRITDNDNPPSSATSTFQVGTYNGNMTGTSSAFASNMLKNRVQYLFYASELKAAGIYSGGPITALTLRVATKNSTRAFQGLTISMANTGNIQVNTGFVPEALTTVYTGNYSTVVGDNTFSFGTPFVWDGVSNVAVQVCFDNSAYGTAEAAGDIVEGNSQPLPSGYRASVYSNTNTGTGCSLGAALVSFFRANAAFTTDLNKSVATVLNNSKSEYLTSNSDLHFYSQTGQLMAKITNLSGHNYGCTQVTLDRAGTGATAFWNSIPSNFLTDKTLQVSPTTPNTSGQYQITLYYTAAEKAGWEAATGNSWSNIRIVKVKGQIKDYTPSTPQPYGPNAVEVVTPVHGTHGSDFTLTYTFNSGFSGFAAGIPGLTPLPITLLNFNGRLDQKSALLDWTTSSETNSKNFDIEKSTDGSNFYKIGSVDAAGNSTTDRTYSFRDNRISSINYYRLRMNDIDGKNKLSGVVVVRYNAATQNMWVVNNPFKNHIDLRFARKAQTVKLQLVSMNGAVVEEKTFTNPADQTRWTLSRNVSAGSYILRATIDNEVFTSKLVRE
jgi:photosystem II stability/assembly factor-like uncharacterized protein